MKIRRVDVARARIPLARPYRISRGELREFRNLLVRIQADDHVGLGECSVVSLTGDIDDAERRLRAVARWLIGTDATAIPEIVERLQPETQPDLGVVAAIDMALWDLAGQAAEAPVHRLLGSAGRRRIPVDYTIGQTTPAGMATRAADMAAQGGFTGFCVKVGGGDVRIDAERVGAVRAAVGSTVPIRADANGGYDVETAIRFLRAVAPYDLEFLEQPVPRGDVDGLFAVARATPTRISVDEGLQSVRDGEALVRRGWPGIFNIKIPKCGGIELSRRIAAIARTAGIDCICGGGLAFEVIRQASRHFVAGTDLGSHDLHQEGPGPASQAPTGDIASPVVTYADVRRWGGAVEVDDRPGLGLAADPTWLARGMVEADAAS